MKSSDQCRIDSYIYTVYIYKWFVSDIDHASCISIRNLTRTLPSLSTILEAQFKEVNSQIVHTYDLFIVVKAHVELTTCLGRTK